MMIECMAGKSGALQGEVYDASPFQYSEDETAIDYYGNLLQAGTVSYTCIICTWVVSNITYRLTFLRYLIGGFNYYGNEIMYSGVNGTEMPASIFFGVVHYQRLRHMVSDKWQVSSVIHYSVLQEIPHLLWLASVEHNLFFQSYR